MRLLWTTPSSQNLCPARLPTLSAAPTLAAMSTSTVSRTLTLLEQYLPFTSARNVILLGYGFLLSCRFWHGALVYHSWCFIVDELWTVNDVHFNSWSAHGCRASVLAGGPWIWRCVQLRLDRKSLSYHSVDEEGIWSGECIDLYRNQVCLINSHVLWWWLTKAAFLQ